MLNIVCVRFDKMEKQRLISSYDEINDTFVGKIDGRNGYNANYGISEGVFLNIDENNLPTSVFVNNASEVFDVPKKCLESANVKISIDCNENCLSFSMFVENSEICSLKCSNDFGIPTLEYLIDCNI